MSIRLSRKKINDMVDRDYSFSSSRSGGGSGAGGGGGVSSQWVDDHYVSKEFFARLFTINGTDANDDDVVVEPNDLETTITNIQMMVGAWTEQYLSALGLSDGGSGGGGAIALQDLVNVEYVGTPSGGQILKYNGTTGKWYNADEGGGTVQDVTLAMPAGFDVQKTTNQGTIALTVSLDRGTGASALGNKLFLATPVTGDGAPEWRALAADDLPDLSSTYVKAADIAEYTWWGQTLQTSGQTKAVDGTITIGTGELKMPRTGGGIQFKLGSSDTYTTAIRLFQNTDVLSIGYETAQESFDTNIYGNNVKLFYGTSSTLGLLLNTSGNVGIGQSSPVTKLDVNGGVKATKFYLYKPNAANDTNAVYFQYVSGQSGVELVGAGFFTDSYVSALGANSSGGGGGATTLAGLTDVDLTNPTAGQALVYRNSHWVNETISATGDYLPLTGGTLTGNLSVKGTHDLSLDNNGISQTSYLGYYIKDTNNKRSAQYVNTVYANGNNSFWMSVTYNVSGSTELDKGFGLTVDKRGNCSWRVDGAPEFRSAIGINLDNLVTTNTEQTISAAKLFSGGITPIAAGSVQTVSASSKIWFKQASATTDNTPNNGLVLEYGSPKWTGQLYMADNGKDGLYWGGWHNGTRQSWMKILDTSSGVTLTTDQTITGAKTFSSLLNTNNVVNTGYIRIVHSISGNTWASDNGAISIRSTSQENPYSIGIAANTDGYSEIQSSQFGVGGKPLVLQKNGGNVGIGTISPGAKLDVNGELRATTYLSCHNAVGEYGTAGWVCFAIVAVSSAWATQPLKFKVSQRGRLGGEITLRFAGVNAASNTTVQEFSYTGNIRAARVVKNGANFSLYIQKHEEYDDIAISLVNLGTFMSSKVTVTWTNSLSSSDPGGTAATCRYYFSNTAYMEWDETNSAVHFVNAGVYSDTFVSALGANSSGGGGGTNLNTLLTSLNRTSLDPATVTNKVLVNTAGTWTWQDYSSGSGTSLNEPLSSINGSGIGKPSTGSMADYAIVWTGTGWGYKYVPDNGGGGGGGSGTVTSIKITVPTGFNVNPTSAITTSGTFAISFATGYSLPTTAIQGQWNTAYSWVSSNGASTVSKTAWGQTYWSAGAPQTISGDIKSATSLEFSGVTNGSNHGGYIDFHYNGGGNDYTSRIIEDQSGILKINNTIWATLSGNVGVGNNSPNYKLDVTGVIHVTTGLLSNGYVTALSDIRYKNVVARVSPRVEDIAGASIIRYTWKDRTDKTIHIGGIAQEWQKILPETVLESEGRLSMDYGVIGTIAAIATARRVVDHEERIKQLERENEQLRKELAAVQTTPNPS